MENYLYVNVNVSAKDGVCLPLVHEPEIVAQVVPAFDQLVSKEGLADEMERGLIDADLGGHVVKKRVAIGGRGKSGGVRTLLA